MKQKVLFKHCDPAGIVFYPRYFEMMNDCVEAWFDQRLGWPFEAMHQGAAVPTAAINTEFLAPSRHGDMLQLELSPTRLGRTSLGFVMTAHCGSELRFRTEATLVHLATTKENALGRPTPWPEKIKTKIEQDMKGQT